TARRCRDRVHRRTSRRPCLSPPARRSRQGRRGPRTHRRGTSRLRGTHGALSVARVPHGLRDAAPRRRPAGPRRPATRSRRGGPAPARPTMRRLVSLALAALGVIGIVLALPARPASAQPLHPLGNFSVNQAIGLDLYPDRVAVTAIVDLAELPTLQERQAVDTNGDGTVSAPESMAYNTRVCNAMAGAVALRVDGHRVQWSVRTAGFAYRPGSAGLHTSRVSCAFKAAADLTRPTTADLVNGYRADRIGWREMTAAGHGVHIVHPPVPVGSVTNSLRSYPAGLLGSPLDQRSARLQVEPGDGPSAGATIHVSVGDPVSRWVAQADRALERLVGGHLTPFV